MNSDPEIIIYQTKQEYMTSRHNHIYDLEFTSKIAFYQEFFIM